MIEVTTAMGAEAAAVLTSLGLPDVRITPLGVQSAAGSIAPERVVAALVEAGVGVRGFAISVPSLEDLFLSLTGEGFNVSG